MEKYQEFLSASQRVFALPLPKVLKASLDYCEYLIVSTMSVKCTNIHNKREQKSYISHQLIETLKKMTLGQRINYYLKVCHFITSLAKGRSQSIPQIRYFVAEVQIKSTILNNWKKRLINMNENGKQLKIIDIGEKKQKIYDLSYYICHAHHGMVELKSVDRRVGKLKELTIRGLNQTQSHLINAMVDYLLWQQIRNMLHSDPLSKAIINSIHQKSEQKQWKPTQNSIYEHLTNPFKLKVEKGLPFRNVDQACDAYCQLGLFNNHTQNKTSMVIKYRNKLLRQRYFCFERTIQKHDKKATVIQCNIDHPQQEKINANINSKWVFEEGEEGCNSVRICGQIQMHNKGYLKQQQNLKLMKEYVGILMNELSQPKKQQFGQKLYDLWEGQWKRDQLGGLLYLNEGKMKAQKKVLAHILKTIAKNILSRKSIMNVSLPIQIFSTQSNLERLLHSFRYGPLLLQSNQSPLLKLVRAFAFCVGSSLLYLDQEKVFNPILGQTCQLLIDGHSACAQQISHHPPICALYVTGKQYKIYGSIQSIAQVHLNSGTGVHLGHLTIDYEDGQQILNQLPSGVVSGLAYGNRKFLLTNQCYHIHIQSQLYLEVQFNNNQPKDFFQGKIYKITEGAVKMLQQQRIKPKAKDLVENVGEVKGIWNEYIKLNDETIADFRSLCLSDCSQMKDQLPSDSTKRKDLIHRRMQRLDEGQREKEILEEQQRRDNKLRVKHT